MHNVFVIILASIFSIQMFANNIIGSKIDTTLNLINEEMVASTITEKSKLEAYNHQSVSYLAIDQKMLMQLVNATIEKNLGFLDYQANYYFYHQITKYHCPIDSSNYTCNSVQIQIIFKYQNKTYEGKFRYEPYKE